MAAKQPSLFLTIRNAAHPELNRVQDNIAAVVNPIARQVLATPIGGAPAPPWIYPNLATGWKNQGTSAAGYHKDALGYVHVKGIVTNNTGANLQAVIFTLPVGYRPSDNQFFPVIVNGPAVNFLGINGMVGGDVTPQAAVVPGASISLGCVFLAEA